MGNITCKGMTDNETWNDCIGCGKGWKDQNPTPGLIHRSTLCERCKNGRDMASKRLKDISRLD